MLILPNILHDIMVIADTPTYDMHIFIAHLGRMAEKLKVKPRVVKTLRY